MNKNEALKMAIEAMQSAYSSHGKILPSYPAQDAWMFHGCDEKLSKSLQACKEALAQPQPKLFLDLSNSNGNHPVQPAQEPVAWNEEEFNAIAYAYRTCPAHEIKMVSDRYQELVNYVLSITHTAPSWQGLSDDEICELGMTLSNPAGEFIGLSDWKVFARAFEAALKEKNAI